MSQESQNSNLSDDGNVKLHSKLKRHRFVDVFEDSSQKRAKSSMLKEFQKAARWLGRSEDPFINFSFLFDVGIEGEGLDPGAESAHSKVSAYESYLYLYALLKDRITGFSQHMAPFRRHPERLNPLTQEMLKAMGSARSDDCSSLRDTGLSYIAMDLPMRRLEPHIPLHADKGSHCGFQHPDLARLLCPMRMLSDFDANPAEMMLKLQDGCIPVDATDFPSFLYAREIEYDPENIQEGLCRGPLLVKVWRHIFTSPSSATRATPGPGCTKGCQAKINGLTEATPRTIAYAALQARWLMCAQDNWRAEDGVFEKEKFFAVIASLFEVDPEDPWCIETLAWWNDRVFKPPVAPIFVEQSGPSDHARFMAQCLARKKKTTSRSCTPDGNEDFGPLHSSPHLSPPCSSPPPNPPRSSPPPLSPPSNPTPSIVPARHSRKSPSPVVSGSQLPHPHPLGPAPRRIIESDGESSLSPPPPSPPGPRKSKGRQAKTKAPSTTSRRGKQKAKS